MPATLYLARHATPDRTRTDIPYFTPPGPPLTAQGESEAAELGAFFRAAGMRHILSSPMERAHRTAQIAAEHASLPLTLAEGLIEWKPGEKDAEIKTRLWPVWEHALTLSEADGPVAMVSHGGPIAVLLAELGMEQSVIDHYKSLFDNRNPLPPAGVWEAARPDPSGAWQLRLAFTPEAYRQKLFV